MVATRCTLSWVLDSRIKSLNYLNNIMAKIGAQQAGALDVCLLVRIGAADAAVVAGAVAAVYLVLRRYESGNQIGARM